MNDYACDAFFAEMGRLALEFDDVMLKTRYSDHMPTDVSLESAFSRTVKLKIPVVSAAMDTVTESKMAIALAKLGGIGVIHRNLSPEEQGLHVHSVKRHLNGRIEKPITVCETETIQEILNRRKAMKHSFHSFPVINNYGKVVGILTSNDFDFCENPNALVKDVMTAGLVSASPAMTLADALTHMRTYKKKVLPLVDSDGLLHGMYVFSDVRRIIHGSSPMFNLDQNGRLRVAAAIGVGDDARKRMEHFPADLDAVVIDTAHGDTKAALETLKFIKRSGAACDVIVGNVTEADSAMRLIYAGADGIKVGQGPGSICTTRIVAGVGCPQLTAVYQCAKAARASMTPVCADGGIVTSGHIPKAIGAGASCVMLGRLLAGCDESPGEVVVHHNSRVKKYRGMGSLGAMQERGGRERYDQGDTPANKLVPEGIEGAVPYTGSLETVLHQLLGGLRAGMGYTGARDISELQYVADFHRITPVGLQISHPHDVMMVSDAPNYTRR